MDENSKSCLACSQIWLNLTVDHRHFGYIVLKQSRTVGVSSNVRLSARARCFALLVPASRNSSGGFVGRRESKKKGDGRELQVARLLRIICREDEIEEDDIIDVFVVVVCACVSFASIQRVRTDQSTSAIFFFFIRCETITMFLCDLSYVLV
jgi:hypothetical protein